jgi:hypothetical protein
MNGEHARRGGRLVGRSMVGHLVIVSCLLVASCAGPSTPPAPSPEDEAGRVVARLATGITLDRYIDMLGRRPDISRPAGSYREVVWVNEVYAVQAIVGDGSVLGYSVTTRSERFRPPIDVLGSAHLGSTPIGEAFGPSSTTALVSSGGPTARGVWWYSEALPASGATNDRAVVLTTSDAGLHNPDEPTLDQLGVTAVPDPDTQRGPFFGISTDDPQLTLMRSMPASTYSIIGPTMPLDELPPEFRFGPTWDDIQAVR